LTERVDYIEGLLGDSVDKHAQELQELRAMHDKHASGWARQLEQWEDHRGENQGQHSSAAERLGELERALGEFGNKHDNHSSGVLAKFEQMHGRVNTCERQGPQLEELKRLHNTLSKEKSELAGHHSILKDRLDSVEGSLGDTIDGHAGHLHGLQVAHEKHQTAFARLVKDQEALRSEKNAQHGTLAERLAGIEALHGETSDKHGQGLQAMHDRLAACERHGSLISNLQRSHDALNDRKADLEAGHATVKERLEYLEQTLGDSADKHSRELSQLAAAHSRHASDLDGLKSLHKQGSASMEERLAYVEKVLGDSADKHAEDLADLRRAHDQLHGRLGACEGHGTVLSELQRAHGSLVNEKATLQTHHATLQERVSYLEDLMNDSADQHNQKLEAAHSKLDEIHGRVSVCEKYGPGLNELKRNHSEFMNLTNSLSSDHGGLRDRMDNMEAAFGDVSNRQTKDITGLKSGQSSHAAMLKTHAVHIDGFSQHKEYHASLPERVGYIEQQLGDSADKHAAEVDELHKKVERESQAREKHHGSFKDILAREREERSNHHATLNERLTYLEGLLNDSADKHERELGQLQSTHQKLAQDIKLHGGNHGDLVDRCNANERALADLTDKQAKDIKSALTKFDHLCTRLSIIKGAWRQETPRVP